MILIALAAVTAPLLPPEIARDLRCVAILGVFGDASVAGEGAYFAAVVGADAMDATGLGREAVRDLMLAQVRIVRSNMPVANELTACITQMRARNAISRAAP